MQITPLNTKLSERMVSRELFLVFTRVSNVLRHMIDTELIDSYLNGPRTLSNDRLSYLIVSSRDSDHLPTPVSTPNPDMPNTASSNLGEIREFDLLICAMHFLGDGMALHRFANEFFTILAGPRPVDASTLTPESSQAPRTNSELSELLKSEFEAKWGSEQGAKSINDVLPAALEDKLPKVGGKMKSAAGKVDFKCDQDKLIVSMLHSVTSSQPS